jgi:DNA polymerase-3 subunit epsilon
MVGEEDREAVEVAEGTGRLDLDRPLAFFDLETTGTDVGRDRIVEISVLKIHPDGHEDLRTRRIDPGIPIPPEATEIHGIRDEDVAGEPRFEQVARSLADFLEDCDLGGFGIQRFDLPLLAQEFQRAGVEFDLAGRSVVDALAIFHRKEPRNLEAAVRFYCGREHEGAHGAEADIRATYDVLRGQLDRYDDLPTRPAELHAYCGRGRERHVDLAGKLVWKRGEVAFNFGKFRGQLLRDVVASEPDYLEWLLRSDFPDEVRSIIEKARQGEFPSLEE